MWIGSYDYDLPFLTLNPECAPLLAALAPDDGALFYHIGRFLLPLAPAPLAVVDAFVQANFRKYNVGLHVRLIGCG